MKNEIVKFEPIQWAKIKFTSPSEIQTAKDNGKIIKSGVRKIAETNQNFIINELKEMLSRVADLCGADNLRKNVVLDELKDLFREDDNLYHLTLSDVWLAFKRGAGGRYEATYGRTTFNHLVNWLYSYEKERVIEIHKNYDQEKENKKQERTSKSMREIVYGIDKNVK